MKKKKKGKIKERGSVPSTKKEKRKKKKKERICHFCPLTLE